MNTHKPLATPFIYWQKFPKQKQLLFLIQETPVNRFNDLDLNDVAKHKNQMVDLVNGYRGKLKAALEVYERRNESDTLAARRVREVWTYLAHVVAYYAGDNIDGS